MNRVGRIPESFVQDVLARVNIVDVIGARVKLKKAGANYVACCPFHHEKTPSFSVAPIKQFYHCFGCGVHGDAIQFLMEHDGLHFVDAIQDLAGRVGLTLPETVQDTVQESYQSVYACLEAAKRYYQAQFKNPAAGAAIEYLKSRGLTGEIAKRFGLGFAPPGWHNLEHLNVKEADLLTAGLVLEGKKGTPYDRFRHRVVFPIHDQRGRVIGFGGRVIGEGEPKYLNSPETKVFHKSEALYGLYEARQQQNKLEQIIVVEGYLDVIALAQFGVTNAVATLGTSLTEKHVENLFRICPDIALCFDGDAAGQRAAWRALELILPSMDIGRKVRFLLLPQGQDPDSLVHREGQAGFLQYLKRAASLPDYLINTIATNLDLGHIDGRLEFIHQVRPLLKKLKQGPLLQMLVERVSQLVGIEPSLVLNETGVMAGHLQARPYKKPQQSRLSPVSPAKKAVAILLWERGLCERLGTLDEMQGVDLPGGAFLLAVVDLLKKHSNLDLSEIGKLLPTELTGYWVPEELYGIYQGIPKAGLEAELLGSIQRLSEQARSFQTEVLLAKAKKEGLNQDEKVQLQCLLASETVQK